MSAAEWEQIKTFFEAALARPSGERSAFLQEALGNCPEVLLAVQQLLACHSSDGPETYPPGPERVFSTGQIIASRFRIQRFIAGGGMGEVYEAFDEKLRLRVAIKTLRQDLVLEGDGLSRFYREVQVARGVSHENLCRVLDLVEHHDQRPDSPPVLCLTMELLDGEDLASYLQKRRPLSPEAALPLVTQICTALEALHETGIVHRDLKPSNIMLIPRRDNDFRVVITDFGLAKPMVSDQNLFESQADFRIGAPYFMAPELWRDSRPSVQSDIYSLGLIIDEMVTDTRAYPTSSVPALYYAKLHENAASPGSRAIGLPPHWEQVILKCLDREPAERYARASLVAVDLIAGPGVPSRVNGLFRRLRGGVSRRAILVGCMATPIVAAVAGAAAINLQPLNTSVSVFSIQNQTSSKELDYICTGTAREVMRRLVRVKGVRVVPVYESARPGYVGTEFSLTGTLQGFQSRVLLNMQMVDNRNNELVWSEDFDHARIENPLDLQIEISERIVSALVLKMNHPRLLPVLSQKVQRLFFLPQSPSGVTPTRNSAALDQYMRGLHLLRDMSVPSSLAAMRFFESAVAQDRNFSLAYASMADTQSVLMEFNYAPDRDLLGRAREYAETAVRLGPETPEAHVSLGAVQQMSWDWSGANTSFQEALRLNPKFSLAHRWYSGLLLELGQFDDAVLEGRTAIEEDPYDYPSYPGFGLILFCVGEYADAITVLKKAIAERRLMAARHNLGNIYAWMAARPSEAQSARYFRAAFDQAAQVRAEEREQSQDVSTGGYSDRMFALYHSLAGDRQSAAPYVARLLAGMESGRTSPVILAWIFTAQHNYDVALRLLERAVLSKDRKLLNAKYHPLLSPLRDTERFRAVIRAMNL